MEAKKQPPICGNEPIDTSDLWEAVPVLMFRSAKGQVAEAVGRHWVNMTMTAINKGGYKGQVIAFGQVSYFARA